MKLLISSDAKKPWNGDFSLWCFVAKRCWSVYIHGIPFPPIQHNLPYRMENLSTEAYANWEGVL